MKDLKMFRNLSESLVCFPNLQRVLDNWVEFLRLFFHDAVVVHCERLKVALFASQTSQLNFSFICQSQELRDRISTSDSVSDDVQDAFGRQLLVLQSQRDSLLQQLEQQKKDRNSYVDVLEEKNALEDSLR